MNRIIAVMALLVLTGAGCHNLSTTYDPEFETTPYFNEEFGFAFDHTADYDINERAQEHRPFSYIGLDVDFFASLRNLVIASSPESVAYLYAAPGLTVEQFVNALEASDDLTEVVSSETTKTNDLQVTEVVSTTQAETNKSHFVFDRGGTLIIISKFLHTDEYVDPIVDTLRVSE